MDVVSKCGKNILFCKQYATKNVVMYINKEHKI
jgi:hypothetical protein